MILKERNPSYDEYKALRKAVGWRMTDETSSIKALDNALYSIVALDSNGVMGMGRVIPASHPR